MVGSGASVTYKTGGGTYTAPNWMMNTTTGSTTCADWWDDSTAATAYATSAYALTAIKASKINLKNLAKSQYLSDLEWEHYNNQQPRLPSVLPKGQHFGLPDGSKLLIDDAGNYQIEDKDAKVTYQANRVREFSPHLNASDMLAQFVKYVGSLGVKQAEVLGLPIELFINWLIIEAAERDHDTVPPEITPVLEHREVQLILRPKCLSCGRFIPRLHRQHRFPFCGVDHAARYVALRSNKTTALETK